MADWYADFMQAIGVTKVTFVGHSMGGLIGLEFASRYPHLVSKAAFISTALAIPVNDALVDLAATKESAAIAAMMDWGHGPSGHGLSFDLGIRGACVQFGNETWSIFLLS